MADYTLAQQISGSLLSDVDADVRLGGLDNIDIDTAVSGRLDSSVDTTVDGKLDAKAAVSTNSDVRTDSKIASDSKVATDSKLVSDSRVASSVDLAPVAVDSCIRVELAPPPATEVHTPWEQRLGLSVLGVELFAWVLSGQTTSTLRPVPTGPLLMGSLEEGRASDREAQPRRRSDSNHPHDRGDCPECGHGGGHRRGHRTGRAGQQYGGLSISVG